MADELFFDGARYISAADAAGLSNLTRDYIARLAREEKVIGKQIGRQWYVSQESLRTFLVGQEYANSQRRGALVRERQQEYGRVQASAVPEKKTAAPKSSSVVPAAAFAAPAIASDLQRKLSEAAMRGSAQAVSKATALAGNASAQIPLYAVSPAVELLHKVAAAALALTLVVGLYTAEGSLISSSPEFVPGTTISPRVEIGAAADSVGGTFGAIASALGRGTDALLAPFFGVQLAQNNSSAGVVAVQISPSQPASASPFAAQTQTTNETIVENPVVERVVESEQVISSGGISESELDQKLQQLQNSLTNQIVAASNANSTVIAQNYNVTAQTNAIDQLTDTTITNPSISGGSIANAGISGGTISGAMISGATFTGTTTLEDLATTGSATSSFGGGVDLASGCFAIAGTCIGSGGAGNPGGSNAEVQFNDNGVFNGSSEFTFNDASDTLAVVNASTTNATTTNLYVSGTIGLGSALPVQSGGTGTTSAPSYGQLLVGNSSGGFSLLATSSLGIAGASSTLLTDNNTFSGTDAFSDLLDLNGGFLAPASSTVGNGALGLTVNGSATTTGNAYFAQSVGIGTTSPSAKLSVAGNGYLTGNLLLGGNATTSSFFATTASSTDLFAQTASFGSLSLGSATTTAGNGFNISSGCFSVNGTCITSGGGSGSSNVSTSSQNIWSALQVFAANASTSEFTATSSVYFTSITNSLLSTNQNGQVVATTSIGANLLSGTVAVGNGGTGINSTPSYGTILVGNGTNYSLTATSSLGLPTFTNLASAYPFYGTGNSTSTLTQFNGGLTAYASSTIGNGTAAGGFTINGGATTTGATVLGGNVTFSSDNSYDIGASGANRPRNVFTAGYVLAGNGLYSSNQIGIQSSSNISAPDGDGTLRLTNNLGNNFSLLELGGGTASFPAIKRDNAGVDIRLADDSGWANLSAANITANGNLSVGTTNTSGIVSGSARYLTVETGTGASETAALELAGYSSTANGALGRISFINTDGGNELGRIEGYVSPTGTATGGLRFFTTNFPNGPVERVRIDQYGDLGIGTTSPYAEFSLAGYSGATTPLLSVSTSSSAGTTTVFTIDQNGNTTIGNNGTQLVVNGSNSIFGGGFVSQASSTVNGAFTATGQTTLGNASSSVLSVSGNSYLGTSVASYLSVSTIANCVGSQALQTGAGGLLTCGSISVGGASTGGGWTTNNVGRVGLATTTDLVAIGATTTPYAKLSVISGATGTTTLALVPISGQTANILDIYNTSGSLGSVFTAAGSLGLGTTTPGSILSINGVGNFVANATSTLYNGLNVTGGCVAVNGTCLGSSSASTTLLANNNTFSGNNAFTASTTFSSVVNTANASTSFASFGSVWLPNLTNSILSTNASGQLVATSSIGVNLLSGVLSAANGGTGWANLTSGDVLFGNGSSALGTSSSLFFNNTTGFLGVGTSNPYAQLTVSGGSTGNALEIDSSASAASTTILTVSNQGLVSVGDDSGSSSGIFTVDASSSTTTISNLSVGNLLFDTDAGIVNLSDIPVDSNAASGVQEAQIINIGGNPLITASGISNGSGGVTNLNVGIGTSTTPYATLQVWGPDASAGSQVFSVVNDSSTTLFTINDMGNVGLGTSSPTALAGFSVATTTYFASNVGIGTTSPSQALSIAGNAYITGASTLGSLSVNNATTSAIYSTTASSTNLFAQTASLGMLNLENALTVGNGGTGINSTPSYGNILLGNGTNYTLTATSSLGLPTFTNLASEIAAAYEFPNNSTSTLLTFLGGEASPASSTIGNGNQNGGLTINGGATTTGNFLVQGKTTLANATSTGFAITGLASSLLSVNANGSVIATTSIGTNLLTGTLGVPNGGTGSTTLSGILLGNGTSPVQTLGVGTGLSLTSGTLSTANIPNSSLAHSTIVLNSQTLTLGDTNDTITAASSTLLTDQNTWTKLQSFSNATSTLLSATTAWIGTLNLTNALTVGNGGTGINSTPSYGQLLVGNGTNYTLTATSSLGLPQFSDLASQIAAAYEFPQLGNGTSTLTQFNGGLTAFASSTIGNGTQTSGLTIFGGATTTGNTYFESDVGVGTTSPYAALSVQGPNGNSSAAPTALAVVGGTGGTGSFAGGGVFLQGGVGGANSGGVGGTGGALELYGGIGGSVTSGTGGPGGNIYIAGGTGGQRLPAGAFAASGNVLLGINKSGTLIGDVGIGTTTPGSIFSINNILNFNTGTSTLYTNFSAATTSVNSLFVTNSSTSTFAGGINIASGCFSINGTCIGGSGGGGSGTVNSGTQGQFAFYNATGAAVSGTSTLFVSTAGNIGIGTTTPGIISGANQYLTIASNGADTQPAIELAGNNNIVGNSVGRIDFYNELGSDEEAEIAAKTNNSDSSLGSLVFSTGQYDTLNQVGEFDPFGDFGIGTTTPGSILSISGVGNFVANATSTLYNGLNVTGGCVAVNGNCLPTSNASSTLLANNNTFSGNNVFSASTTFSSLVNISNASTSLASFGSLWLPGITTNALLKVNSTGQVAAAVAGTDYAAPLTGSTGQVAYFSGTNTPVGTSSLDIASTGFVGIGTTTPIDELQVAGLANPIEASSTTSGLNGPTSVTVSGRYAYVANYGNSSLVIFDISNPASPVEVGSTTSGLNYPLSVTVSGRYAYVASYNNSSLVVFDISNPASPVEVGSTTSGLSEPGSVTVSGRYAYVASQNNNSLVIFDISNPASPVEIGSTTSGLSDPYSVTVSGRYAYVASLSNNSLIIFDISNPASPVKVGSTTSGLSDPQSVTVSGRYAYVANYGNSSLVVFDISNPASPVKIGSTTSGLSDPESVSVSGRYAYVASGGNNSLVIFDISNPASPVKIGSTTSGLNGPISVTVSGRYAYVASGSNNALVTFQIGGEYTQSLEAGTLQAGSLELDNDLQALDGAFAGGLTVGNNANVGGSLDVTASTYNATTTAGQAYSLFSVNTASSTNPLFNVFYNGDVGIGTTTPGSIFSINNILNFNTGTSTLYTNFSAATTSVNSLFVTNSSTSTFAGGINIASGCFSVGGTCVGGSGGGGSGTVNSGTQGQFAFYNATGAAVSGTSTLFVSTAGNIGIGTTTPGIISGANQYLTIASNGADTQPAIELAGNNNIVGNSVGRIDFYNELGSDEEAEIAAKTNNSDSSLGSLVFSTGQYGTLNQVGEFDPFGDFGIGTTTPGSILSISGVGNFVANATSTLYNSFAVGGNTHLAGSVSIGNAALQGAAPLWYQDEYGTDTSAPSELTIGGQISGYLGGYDSVSDLSDFTQYLGNSDTPIYGLDIQPEIASTSAGEVYSLTGAYVAPADNGTGGDETLTGGEFDPTLNNSGGSEGVVGIIAEPDVSSTAGTVAEEIGGDFNLNTSNAETDAVAGGAFGVSENSALSDIVDGIVSEAFAQGAKVSDYVEGGDFIAENDTQSSLPLLTGSEFKIANVGYASTTEGVTIDSIQNTDLSDFNAGLFIGDQTAGNIGTIGQNYQLYSSSTNPFVIQAGSGSVGIGTTTPGSILSINGVGNFVANATSTLYNGLNVTGGCVAVNGNCLPTSNASSTLLANNNTFSGNNLFSASTTFSSLVNISNASTSLATFGSLWLPGITTNALLKVNSTGQVAAAVAGTDYAAPLTGSTGQVAYFSGANTPVGTSSLDIASTGFVGIDTTSPATILEVDGSSGLTISTTPGIGYNAGCGVYSCGSDGSFQLLGGPNGTGSIPVPTFYPTKNNTVLALDLVPHGTPTDSGYGDAWADICTTDQITSGNGPTDCLHMGAGTASGIFVGSAEYNSGTQLPLKLGFFNGDTGVQTVGITIQPSGNVGIGTTTPATNLSVAGNGYLTGALGVGVENTTAGTLQTSGTATLANLIDSGVTASSLMYANSSKQLASVSLPSYVGLSSGTLSISSLPVADLAADTISGVTLGNNLSSATFNNGGSGTSSGSTYNGSSALTVSYNTVGAPSTSGTNASGTWGINVTGTAGGETLNTVTGRGSSTGNVIVSSNYMQAPTFYSYNNSSYYMQPSNNTVLNTLNIQADLNLNGTPEYGDNSGISSVNWLCLYDNEVIEEYGSGCDSAGDGDVAEYYGTVGQVPERGDIVALASSTTSFQGTVTNPAPGESTTTPYTVTIANVKLATAGDRALVVGAVPTSPGDILSGHESGLIASSTTPQLVALTGHVPITMTLDGGSVAIGDPITVSTSTPGAGMKATTSGMILGYALAPYTGAGSGEGGTNMIEVYIQPQQWIAPSDFNALLALSQFGAASSSTPITAGSFMDSFIQNLLAQVTQWLASGTNGIQNLFASVIHANEVDTQKLCVSDSTGAETCVTKAQLDALLASAGTAGSSANEQSSTSTAPILQINGDNPAIVQVGSTYADLGATIIGPQQDLNLGIAASVDGATSTPIANISIDTSVAGTHTILYSATDQNGVIGSAERTVIVVDPDSATSSPDTSGNATSTDATSTGQTSQQTSDSTSTPDSDLSASSTPDTGSDTSLDASSTSADNDASSTDATSTAP